MNSTGLPADGQRVTARELVQLAQHIWAEYPEYYRYYAQPDFTWNNILQRNRNPLLPMNIGADGMKTGFTEKNRATASSGRSNVTAVASSSP